jgi:ubiquitin-conjugating enzyme E2 Z
MNNKTDLRIVNDLSDFMNNKPDGIYLYINKRNFYKNYALIIGPKNTPYFGGFFLFEINFPKEYPERPPYVKFLTTDVNVRFNPNLYGNGKVCLSILGTWAGPKWRPVMNLKLVLLSIQSLLGEYPIQNEPGFDQSKPDDQNSINYSNYIIYHTYRLAILDVLENKFTKYSKYFKKEIKEEFKKNYERLNNDLLSYCVSIGKYSFPKDIYFLQEENKINFHKILEKFKKVSKKLI